MMMKRVVWHDSNARISKPIKYRNHYARGYKGGWVIDIPGDNNIYKSHYCALNAIDAALGGHGKRVPSDKRTKYGVVVIGKKDGETA